MTERTLNERYELETVIGHGGMAEVWRGYDRRLGRDVAVKVLRSDLATDEVFVERLRREARSVARLTTRTSSRSTTRAGTPSRVCCCRTW